MIAPMPSRFRARLFLLLTILLFGSLAITSVASAQTKTFYWERFDVDVQVQDNGDLLVTERQVLRFSGAPFTFGYRNIPSGRNGNNDGIDQFTVREGDIQYQEASTHQPYTFDIERSGSETEITWYFPPATGPNSYVISYRVRGAVRTEPSGDQVFWNALPSDLGARVENGTVTIRLPEGIQAAATTARFGGVESDQIQTAVGEDGRTVTFTLLQARPSGDAVEVGVRFPSGQLALETPGWQRAEQRADVYNVILLVTSLLILVGGPLLALLNWYLRGRDPQVGVVPDYVSEPPDDLPPAVVGTLIDETAHIHDVMSTLVDLAERGYLIMEEKDRGKDYAFRRTDKALEGLRPFERKMIDGIFSGRRSRDLDDLRYKFSNKLPGIRKDLYKELEQRGFVTTSPESVRNRYGCLAFLLIGGGFLSFFALGSLFGDGVAFAVCPAIAIGLTGVVLFITGRYMPSKTQSGAEAAASWLAFKNYLQDIEKYTKLEEATDIFQKYLAYAVAFGLERSWIRKFSAVPSAPIPPWYMPYPYGAGMGRRRGGLFETGGRGGSGSGSSGRPSLEGMSGGLAGGLAGMSSGLTRMLTNTQTVMQSTRSSSSSGGGGGFSGGFSGGSSGGGGGGFG